MAKLSAFFLTVFYTVSAFFSLIPSRIWYGEKQYEAQNPDELLFSAALIADTHSDSSFFNERSKILRKTVCGISQAQRLPDTLVIAGDLTNASDEKEYAMLEWCLKTFNRIPVVIPATGNHDTRASDTYEEAERYFSDFVSAFGISTEKTYYSTRVNGCPFIVLGSEGQLRLEAELSGEQLAMFENELKNAVGLGLPVFIVAHQPLYGANNVVFDPSTDVNHGLGAQSGAVEEIIRKYAPQCSAPVFYISGHLHWNYNVAPFDTSFCENLVSINLPSTAKGNYIGTGMMLEVYKNRILIRGINFITQQWQDGIYLELPLAD